MSNISVHFEFQKFTDIKCKMKNNCSISFLIILKNPFYKMHPDSLLLGL